MDPATGLTILGTAVGSAKVVEKLLGPTADYLGAGLRSWTEKRVENTKRIFLHATKLLGDRIDEPGGVPPKVLKGILEDGSFCDDQLSAEYFGGVLASSRTGISRDDRGASFTALLSRLTTYQIRTHFIFYRIVRELFVGTGISVSTSEGRNQLKTFVPYSVYVPAMDFASTEANEISSIMSHVMFGLARERLIEDQFHFGGIDYVKRYYATASTAGFIFTPSALGVELLLWATGQGRIHIAEFLAPGMVFPEHEFTIPAGSEPVHKPPAGA
jgi:hypothetical protein